MLSKRNARKVMFMTIGALSMIFAGEALASGYSIVAQPLETLNHIASTPQVWPFLITMGGIGTIIGVIAEHKMAL